jgi:hypothetical protein
MKLQSSTFLAISCTCSIGICVPCELEILPSTIKSCYSKVSCINFKTLLETMQCSAFGAAMDLEIQLTIKFKSGLLVIYYTLPTSCVCIDLLVGFEYVFADCFNLTSIAVDGALQYAI